MKNIARLENFTDYTKQSLFQVARYCDCIEREIVNNSSHGVKSYGSDIRKEIDALIKKSEVLREESLEHYLFVIMFGFRAGAETLKESFKELNDSVLVFFDDGERYHEKNMLRVHKANLEVDKNMKEVLRYLLAHQREYRVNIAKTLRELYTVYGTPFPENAAFSPAQN